MLQEYLDKYYHSDLKEFAIDNKDKAEVFYTDHGGCYQVTIYTPYEYDFIFMIRNNKLHVFYGNFKEIGLSDNTMHYDKNIDQKLKDNIIKLMNKFDNYECFDLCSEVIYFSDVDQLDLSDID